MWWGFEARLPQPAAGAGWGPRDLQHTHLLLMSAVTCHAVQAVRREGFRKRREALGLPPGDTDPYFDDMSDTEWEVSQLFTLQPHQPAAECRLEHKQMMLVGGACVA